MDVLSFLLGFVKGKAGSSYTDSELGEALDYINGEPVYTVSFYDGDTLIQSEYGASGFVPTAPQLADKSGKIFAGWNPEVTNVTDNIKYQAVWEDKMSFATASWDDISRVSNAGRASKHFSVGDTKNVTLTKKDGSTETIQVAVAGFDHDVIDTKGTLAGMSIVCMTVPNVQSIWDESNITHYIFAEIESKLNNNSLATDPIVLWLPEDLRSVIKEARKTIDAVNGVKWVTAELYSPIWMLSLDELGHTGIDNYYTMSNGKRYALFDAGDLTVAGSVDPVYVAGTTTKASYWLRHIKTKEYNNNSQCINAPYYVDGASSKVSYTSTLHTTPRYIRFGFCV